MGEFVGNERIADEGSWSVFLRAKGHVLADGKGSRIQTIRERCRPGVGMGANVRKAGPEGGLHARLDIGIQGIALTQFGLDRFGFAEAGGVLAVNLLSMVVLLARRSILGFHSEHSHDRPVADGSLERQ
jgi:hypothetical protein